MNRGTEREVADDMKACKKTNKGEGEEGAGRAAVTGLLMSTECR